MAGKKNNRSNFRDIEFINYKLSTEEKKAFRLWYKNEPEKIFDMVINTIASGYKSSCSWQSDSECFVHALTCQEENNPNYGKCLTSRSSDYWEAQALTMYKHLELSEGGIWVFEDARDNWG